MDSSSTRSVPVHSPKPQQAARSQPLRSRRDACAGRLARQRGAATKPGLSPVGTVRYKIRQINGKEAESSYLTVKK